MSAITSSSPDATPALPRQGSTTSQTAAAAARGLACASCQSRKVKCDRLTPCGNCTRRNERCVPGAVVLPKQRRRRFAERELLDRLRSYEGLLKANNIRFDPMHKDYPERKSLNLTRSATKEEVSPKSDSDALPTTQDQPSFQAKSYWTVVDERSANYSDDDSDASENLPIERQIRSVWEDVHLKNGHILPFGQPLVPIDLSQRHPDQVTIFKLWQIYLDNVNPLLKITHTPTLQPRIISAGSNVASIKPPLNALMFSIYCIAVTSLSEAQCNEIFGLPKRTVETEYQLYCQQALSNCGILRTSDRESLTALYLYLSSIATNMDPQSVMSLLGIAVRIARRMQLQSESSYAKLPALEAELRRRLWWSMVLFDSRMGELSGCVEALIPIWDCRIPINVNDFELNGDMQASPKPQSVSEAIFPAVRSDIGDMVRNSNYYLDFVNPALKLIGGLRQRVTPIDGSEAEAQARYIEENYLAYCNPENSVHFLTLWFTRQIIAKTRLMEHYSNIANNPALQTSEQRNFATQQALDMLEADVKLMRSPLVTGYRWYLSFHLPLPAYFQILLDLRKRPSSGYADRAWQAMSEHYDARGLSEERDHVRMFRMFSKIAMQAWQACEEAAAREMKFMQMPRLIAILRKQAEEMFQAGAPRMVNDMAKMRFAIDAAQVPLPEQSFLDADIISPADLEFNGPSLLGIDLESIDWDAMDWNPLQSRAWG